MKGGAGFWGWVPLVFLISGVELNAGWGAEGHYKIRLELARSITMGLKNVTVVFRSR